MKEPLRFRGVQLDLARQIETVEFIREFTDMIAANGHNVLFLYLEGRIRTAAFPYPADNECYTPEQMREVVAYAATRGVDVAPGISLHGHAELFLEHPEMRETAELRGGINGRFWAHNDHDFCPSQAATYEFFEKYLKEICDIFPSEYFHVGLDEVWNIGYCEKCQPQAAEFSGEQRLFLNNLLRCRDILSRLGKRVMMWDDMFEYYRDILPEVPRDVIMVNWQYADDVQNHRSHFFNLRVEHILAEYDRLGFEYIIGPSDYSSSNVRTFTEYADNFTPLGGLVTVWEKKTTFMHKSIPTTAYAGRLWSDATGKPEAELFADAMENLFGSRDEKLLTTLRFCTEKRLDKETAVSLPWLLNSSYFGYDFAEFEALNLIKLNLEEITPQANAQLGKRIIDNLIAGSCYNILALRLKQAARALFDPLKDSAKGEQAVKGIYQDVKALGEKRVRDWQKYRPGIAPCHIETLYKKYLELIESLPELAKNNGAMRVRFCLPDAYSAENCSISLKYSGQWHEVFNGCCKPSDTENALFTQTFLVPRSAEPEAFKLEARGYGGQGLAFVDVHTDAGHFVPSALTAANGRVIDPEYVLDDDCKWSFLGEKDTAKAYCDRAVADAIHTAEYSLRKE